MVTRLLVSYSRFCGPFGPCTKCFNSNMEQGKESVTKVRKVLQEESELKLGEQTQNVLLRGFEGFVSLVISVEVWFVTANVRRSDVLHGLVREAERKRRECRAGKARFFQIDVCTSRWKGLLQKVRPKHWQRRFPHSLVSEQPGGTEPSSRCELLHSASTELQQPHKHQLHQRPDFTALRSQRGI